MLLADLDFLQPLQTRHGSTVLVARSWHWHLCAMLWGDEVGTRKYGGRAWLGVKCPVVAMQEVADGTGEERGARGGCGVEHSTKQSTSF